MHTSCTICCQFLDDVGSIEYAKFGAEMLKTDVSSSVIRHQWLTMHAILYRMTQIMHIVVGMDFIAR